MKYTLSLNISLPRIKVVELFNNPDNWEKWQESFVCYEPLKGSPGEEGSKTKLFHKIGPSRTEMIETVESNLLPEEMTCIYEAPGFLMGAWNRVTYRFVESGENETKWEFNSEFRCRGILKIMSLVMPNMFRKASLKDMNNFKIFAEKHIET